jgi:cytidylate kinase
MDTSEASPRSRLVVALDGPGSSGKSSVGAAAARELGYRFFDTGLLYRAITWLALDRQVGSHDEDGLVALVDDLDLAADQAGHLSRVLSDGRDVTDAVRGPEVDANVSEISAVPAVRTALLERQRALAAEGRIIMAGRDIGTVVLPDADLKLFLDASVEERARRRTHERDLDPDGPEANKVLDALRERDRLDTTRPVAPLRPAPDARILVTDGNEFADTVDLVVGAIRDVEARAADEAAGIATTR